MIETFGADSQGAEQRAQEAIAARDAAVAASSQDQVRKDMVRKAQERLRKDMVR